MSRKNTQGKIRAGLKKAVRRGMALLLCAVILAGTAPETVAGIFAAQSSIARAEAAELPTVPKVYIGDTLLDAKNDTYETSKARFTMVDGEAFLILNGLDTGSGIAGHEFASGKYAGLYVDGDITLVLFKSNSITCAAEAATESYGIYVTGKLTLINVVGMSASLAAEGGDAAEVSAGIYADSISIPKKARQISLEEDGGIGRNQVKVIYSGVGVTLNATGGDVTIPDNAILEDNDLIASYGICVESTYTQDAGTVTANGGKVSGTTARRGNRRSYGLHTLNYTQNGGSLSASGGSVDGSIGNYNGDGFVYSIGVGIGGRDAQMSRGYVLYEGEEIGSICVNGGKIQATGGTITSNYAMSAHSVGIWSICTSSYFGNCEVECNGGVTTESNDIGTGSYGSVTSGNFELAKDAKFVARTGAAGGAEKCCALECRKEIVVSGGELDAYSAGGIMISEGITTSAMTIKQDSGAVIKGEAEPTVLGKTATNNSNRNHCFGISIGLIASGFDARFVIEKNSNAQVTAIGTREKGAAYLRCGGLYLDCPSEIASGSINAQLKKSGIASMMYGGAMVVVALSSDNVCNISGGIIELEAEGGNSGYAVDTACVASGLFVDNSLPENMFTPLVITGGSISITTKGENAAGFRSHSVSALNYEFLGEELTIESEWKAVVGVNGVPSVFNGAVVKASEEKEATSSELLENCTFEVADLNSYKYINAVCGTETAPYIADIDFTQKFSLHGITAQLDDTLPADAGVVRYVAGEVSVTDKHGVDSTNTSVSDISIDQKTGILTAKMNAVLDSRDDMITIPVSVRSEKYAPVLRNIIVTVSDKDVAVLEGVTQESTSYGQTLSAPVYTAPVTGGTETVSYSGKLADGTVYEASGTAPDQAGHYTVKVTYETDETRYIGKADFAIYPADISEAEVTLGEQAEADGSAHNVVIESVTVGGRTLVEGTDYEITAGSSATEIENTVATLTGIGNNCTGSRTFTWSLRKPAPAATDFTLPVIPADGYDYSGAAVDLTAPAANVSGMGAVTVYYEGISGTSYEKTIAAPKDAGKYAVTFDVEEGTKYRAAEGLVIGEVSIRPVEYTGEKSVTVYVPGGRATEGVSLSLPLLPDGNYSTPETDCTWIDGESIQLNDNTLTLNTKADTPEYGSVAVTIPVVGLRNYQAFSVSVYVEATALEETAVTITGEGVSDGHLRKTYGDAGFTLTAEAQKPGGGETVTWSSADPSVADVDPEGKVTIGGIGETKIKANYISDTSIGIGELLVTVDKKGVKVTGLDAADKVYDGTINATVTGTAVLAGLTEDDAEHENVTVDTSLVVARFEDKNAGTVKTVTFSGAVLAGVNAKNYKITETDTAQADISPVSVEVNVSAVSRAYEKDHLNVTLVPGAVAGVIGDDQVSVDVTGATAAMADDTVGSDKAVTVSGVALAGEDAANYKLSAQPTGVTVTIQKAVWTKTVAWTQAQTGTAAEFDLADYIAPGGTLGAVSVSEGEAVLDGVPEVLANKLTYRFKTEAQANISAVVTIPVEDSASYNDYTLSVSLKTLHDHAMVAVLAMQPTCTQNGNISHYRCSVCGKLFRDASGETEVSAMSVLLPALGHDWGTVTYVWAEDNSTVTATRICNRDAGHVETETVATAHTGAAATCETAGEDVYEAVFTGAAFVRQEKVVRIPALGHDWGEWTVVTPAAEDTPGEEQRVCRRDSTHVETRIIPAFNHVHIPVHHNREEPTASTPGNIEYWECSGCHRYFTDSEGKNEVDFEDIMIPVRIAEPVNEEGFKAVFDEDTISRDVRGAYIMTYTGSALKPAVIVTNNGKLLVEGEDYTLKYANNVNVSKTATGSKPAVTATVTVSGKGFYTGKQVLSFSILQKPIGDSEIAVGSTVIEKGKAANPVVTYLGNVLKKGKDYNVSAVKDGKVTINGEGNFGSVRVVKVIELEKSEYKKTAIKVVLSKVNRVYNGKPQTLTCAAGTESGELTVKNANGDVLNAYNPLTGAGDYFVTYSGNVDAGTVKVTVTGCGAYSGSVKKSFRIAPAKDTAFTVRKDRESYTFVKSGVKPKLTVTGVLQGGTEVMLVEGRDYKVTCSANKKVGTGKCKLTFMGNYKGARYTGTATDFTITAAPMNNASTIVIAGDMVYKKTARYQPKPYVIVNGSLVTKSDYQVAYAQTDKLILNDSETKNCGITVSAKKGNNAKYTDGTGTKGITASYNVVSGTGRTDVTKAKVTLVQSGKTVKSVAYTGNAITFSPDVVAGTAAASVSDIELTLKVGKTTVSSADVEKYFNIYYADNVEKGKATIILYAKPDVEGQPYIGACSGTFTISSKVIG